MFLFLLMFVCQIFSTNFCCDELCPVSLTFQNYSNLGQSPKPSRKSSIQAAPKNSSLNFCRLFELKKMVPHGGFLVFNKSVHVSYPVKYQTENMIIRHITETLQKHTTKINYLYKRGHKNWNDKNAN